MSRKRRDKKQDIHLSESAERAMNKYGKEVHDSVRNNLRSHDSSWDIMLPNLSAHHAREGFKKGYDVGKREERRKSFDVIKVIRAFENEVSDIAKKYGMFFSVIGWERTSGTIPCEGVEVTLKTHCIGKSTMMENAYVNRDE
jgi:hypothetical protein